MDGIRGVAPTAALLAFAVVYFGVMHDAGLFDPLIRRVVRLVGRDPGKVVFGTAVLATVAHLDGAGASTFMVTVPTMLPIYRRLGMDPLILTCTTAMAAGTMNILPWGGPATRAATTLQVGVGELFGPLVDSDARRHGGGVWARRVHRGAGDDVASHRARGARRRGSRSTRVAADGLPRFFWFNAALTVATLAALVVEVLPLPVVFLLACAIALVVNFPNAHTQRERLEAHGHAAMVMVTTVLAAGLFAGIMTGHRDAHVDGARHRRRAAGRRPAAPARAARRRLDAAQPRRSIPIRSTSACCPCWRPHRRPPAGRPSMLAVRR